MLQSWGMAAFATVFSLATLPYESMVVVDAFGRAAWRMLVSRRHLLEWRPVSRVQPGTQRLEPRAYRRVLWVCHAAGAITLVGVAVLRPVHLPIALPFAIVWIVAPWLVAWLDGTLADLQTDAATGVDASASELGAARGAA
jgi:hypothetical protein